MVKTGNNVAVLLTISMIWVGSVSSVSANSAGTSGFSFVGINANAYSASLGNSGSAIAGRSDLANMNPANLTPKSFGISFSHLSYLEATKFEAIDLGFKAGKKSAFGISFSAFLSGDIEKTDYQGATTGSFNTNAYRFRFTYNRQWQRIYSGVSVNILNQKIDDASASAVSLDAGLLIPTGTKGLNFSVAVANLGTSAKFDKSSDPLPIEFRTGVAYQTAGQGFLATGDIVSNRDNGIEIHGGLEGRVKNVVSARVGFSSGADIGNELNAGLGFHVRSLDFNYAYAPTDDFNTIHKVTLSIHR